jgi:hypothetical protein
MREVHHDYDLEILIHQPYFATGSPNYSTVLIIFRGSGVPVWAATEEVAKQQWNFSGSCSGQCTNIAYILPLLHEEHKVGSTSIKFKLPTKDPSSLPQSRAGNTQAGISFPFVFKIITSLFPTIITLDLPFLSLELCSPDGGHFDCFLDPRSYRPVWSLSIVYHFFTYAFLFI